MNEATAACTERPPTSGRIHKEGEGNPSTWKTTVQEWPRGLGGGWSYTLVPPPHTPHLRIPAATSRCCFDAQF